jgi:hypothetical protein
MTIARAQMNRQLYQMGGMGIESLSPMQPAIQPAMQSAMYNPLEENYYSGMPMMMAGGGIANLVDREKYGLGSKIKKFVRNVIPNEVASIASAAGPVVAFFNPALGAAMTGLGNFDKTGRIGSSLGKAALTYGGATIARGIGGAGFPTTGQEFLTSLNPFAGYNPQSGFMGLESLFTSPIGTQSGLNLGQFTDAGRSSLYQMEPFVGSPTAGTLSKTPGTLDQLRTIFDPTSGVDFGTRAQTAMNLSADAIKSMYTIPDGKGGREIDKKAVIATLSAIPSYLDAKKKADEIGLSSNEFNEQVYNQEKQSYQTTYQSRLPMESFGITPPPVKAMAQGGMMDDGSGILSIKLTPAQDMAMGGRMEYAMGSEIPVRQNQGGVSELDLRAKGGYIPVGIKEKADDVPAMLSKNEFVFTADAVRGAGNGNINKGAQKMYKLMKSLEKKVKKTKVA